MIIFDREGNFLRSWGEGHPSAQDPRELQRKDKYIGAFPHFIADAGEDRIGRWLDEKIDLARVYAEIWKDAAPAHLVDIAVFWGVAEPGAAACSARAPADMA